MDRSVLISGGHLLDPVSGVDGPADLLVIGNKICRIGPPGSLTGESPSEQFDASGCVVSPGFIDLHCHLRQPGFEDKETIASGTAAAARGGFTTVCCMANTSPICDNRTVVEFVRNVAAAEGHVRVLPIAAITKGQAGTELTEMGDLVQAGAVAFSDDGRPVANSRIMRHALEYSRMFQVPIIQHSEDPELARGGVMNEGSVSTRLGLKGMPVAAEEIMVARDIALVGLAGGHLHVAHVSTAATVEHIRRAKARGLAVTAEVTPHHLAMTDEWVAGWRPEGRVVAYDTNTKVNPPLRSAADVAAVIDGLVDGTIDAVATDHAPHTSVDKLCEYDAASFGISGLETALALLLSLAGGEGLEPKLLVEKLTAGPARVLGHQAPALRAGNVADITVFAPNQKWKVYVKAFASRGKNSPLEGLTLRGRVIATFIGGKLAYLQSKDRLGVAQATEAR